MSYLPHIVIGIALFAMGLYLGYGRGQIDGWMRCAKQRKRQEYLHNYLNWSS